MAFNLGMMEPKRDINDQPKEEHMPEPTTDKVKYYIEWWDLGTAETDIKSGQTSTSNLKHLLKKMLAGTKRTIIYIKRLSDDRVIWDRR